MARPDLRGRRRLPVALAALALTASACTTSTAGPSPGPEVGAGIDSYAALGDSFTSAPLVPDTALADGCFRSSGNYPALLAATLEADLRDVSCSGADTGDITGPQVMRFGAGSRVPAQLRAVPQDADLVTVGIGGNDENLFATLVHGCTRAVRDGTTCAEVLAQRFGQPEAVIRRTGRRVASALRAVRDRAPDALVVLVGYPRLADPSTPCPRLPVTGEDLRLLADLERRLDQALAGAADRTGSEYVDMHARSQQHAICADDPWVNGARTQRGAALAYHPYAEGQQAVADAVLELLEG